MPRRTATPSTWEKQARLEEVRWHRVGTKLSLVGLIAGALTALAAVWAAWQATQAVSTAQDAVLRASREERITSGIEAMGGETAAQRVAGIGLLGRAVSAELERVAAGQGGRGPSWLRLGLAQGDDDVTRERGDAAAAYTATLDALENYVVTWPDSRPDGARRARRGQVPRDVYYAANEVKRLASGSTRSWFADVSDDRPSLDLSGANLAGIQTWDGWDTTSLTLYGRLLDLRDADLVDTHWAHLMGGSDLRGADLIGAWFQVPAHGDQPMRSSGLVCADLRGADLTDAHLEGVDLRGALLQHATLTDAHLTGAKLWGADTREVVGPAGLDGALSVGLGAGEGRRPGRFGSKEFSECMERVSP